MRQNLPKSVKIRQNLPKFAKICQNLPKFTKLSNLSKPHKRYKKFKFLNLFENIALTNQSFIKKEIWINTSEAEILPALNPSYEISKALIGQLVSFKKHLLNKGMEEKLKIKKIILGPFKSELNPIGIMSPEFVSKKILNLAFADNLQYMDGVKIGVLTGSLLSTLFGYFLILLTPNR